MEPLAREFGWSRTLISAGTTMTSVVTALLSPAVGVLIDRFGSAAAGLARGGADSLAIAAIGLANGSPGCSGWGCGPSMR